ncbi:hypothetical protein M404DRAFT_1001668 [Pisolithus tinctorius Marx 270]|uniref:Eukaryotic translation initiation factor 5B n=1 Tax=Pisolithus tinctorius Marx 270 TaxID=870435 RepID=A0A0C3P667_PISTI|nr:hypothetical protein M404DRAFT_1001668 [Pisolithus tinctorius Marx 270]
MPPKNKGKKGKRADDDDYWDKMGTPAPTNPLVPAQITGADATDEVESKPQPSAMGFSAFGALQTDDGPPEVDENEDFGGLMSMIKANTTKQKKDKKKKGRFQAVEDEDEDEEVEVVLPPAAPAVEEAGKEAGGEAEGGDSAAAAAKKKKKKKGKKDEDAGPPAAVPVPTPVIGKKAGGLGALRAMMEEKKRLEEEARRREEEERRRIEEEERKAEEEAKRKEEERLRRKEREKAKRDLAKKEGRLLTKKQKEERAAAELRRQALLSSGVVVEGLQQPSDISGTTGKKVVYGNRKKKSAATGRETPITSPSSPAPSSRPLTPEPAPEPTVELVEPSTKVEGVKDDWDASSDEEETKPVTHPGVKDSWDDSSEEETISPPPTTKEPPKAPSAPVSKPSRPTRQPTAKVTAEANGSAAKKPQPADASGSSTESSSEESSSEEEDSDDSSEESSEESDDGLTKAQRLAAQRKAEAVERRAKAHEAALAARSKDDLRSPICCILGHVDTGKTKLLDKIRQTNVQEGEAGGITQQIGATYFPVDAIKTKTAVLNKDNTQEYKIPGLLVIDTPGHESFTNLRSRGSSLCNIAILVVDIMHGLEPQTLESLRLLRDRKTPFIVALNKIDRMYGWKATPDGAFQESLAKQPVSVKREFEDRVQKTILAFAEQGLNAVLYYENRNFARNVSLVPTSAITGEGVPDMIMLLVNLTQQRMSDRLMYLSELECTVLEVKVIEGLGTTIDVVLSNGILREGDKIVVCGLNGPIITQVRALLTPQPLRELRVKSQYVHHKEVRAALGVKVVAPDLEKAIAGSRLLVVGPDDDEDDLRDEVMSDLTSLLNSIDKSGRGVCVQASTLGSLEALLDFLKVSKIPVNGINIGPIHKKDVMRCATMLEKAKELAVILAFDVPVDKDAEKLAEEMGIRIFKADIIYHLFDAFTAYNNEIMEAKRRDAAPQAVWPCRLKIIAAFCKRDPIILGVDILDGNLRIGTPMCVVKVDPTTQKKDIIDLGKMCVLYFLVIYNSSMSRPTAPRSKSITNRSR